MSSRHPHAGICGIIAVFIAISPAAFGKTLAAMPAENISPADFETVKKVVRTFCINWKALKFDSMYVMMSAATQADMPKAKFINTYGVNSENSGRMGSFVVKEAIPGEVGIVVKAELIFVKENAPTAVNGIHNFHLVKDNGIWQVKTIVPPIIAPQEMGGSGGHPGE